jgi:hypothetical protein
MHNYANCAKMQLKKITRVTAETKRACLKKLLSRTMEISKHKWQNMYLDPSRVWTTDPKDPPQWSPPVRTSPTSGWEAYPPLSCCMGRFPYSVLWWHVTNYYYIFFLKKYFLQSNLNSMFMLYCKDAWKLSFSNVIWKEVKRKMWYVHYDLFDNLQDQFHKCRPRCRLSTRI